MEEAEVIAASAFGLYAYAASGDQSSSTSPGSVAGPETLLRRRATPRVAPL
jgi:hypothetical protein